MQCANKKARFLKVRATYYVKTSIEGFQRLQITFYVKAAEIFCKVPASDNVEIAGKGFCVIEASHIQYENRKRIISDVKATCNLEAAEGSAKCESDTIEQQQKKYFARRKTLFISQVTTIGLLDTSNLATGEWTQIRDFLKEYY